MDFTDNEPDRPARENSPTPVRYTLKEASDITGRSVTTLRRYIRNGRLAAAKSPGRFGPEFTMDEASLLAAGFEILSRTASRPRREQAGASSDPPYPVPRRDLVPAVRGAEPANGARSIERVLLDYVPADLYRELSMKHEQILVQYGMIRASGQRLFEFKEEAERRSEDLKRAGQQLKELQDRFAREIGFLKRHTREAELELEEKNVEIAALREKVRVLELLTRNAMTTDSIERQFQRVFEREREIGESLDRWLDTAPKPPPEPEKLDH